MEEGTQWPPWKKQISVLLQKGDQRPQPPSEGPRHRVAARPKRRAKSKRAATVRSRESVSLQNTNQATHDEPERELQSDDEDMFGEQQKIFDRVVWHEHLDEPGGKGKFPITKDMTSYRSQRHRRVPVMTAFGSSCKDPKSRKVGGSKAYKNKYVQPRMRRKHRPSNTGVPGIEPSVDAAKYADNWDKEMFVAKEYKAYLQDKRYR